MKKIFIIILLAAFTSACSSNDDDNGIDCRLFDPEFPELFVRMVDENGVNLIRIGTIDPENITVEGDFMNPGFRYIPPHEYAEPDAEIRKYDNTLSMFIPREEKFEYKINLDDSTSITLEFEAELVEIPCELFYYVPTGAVFNNQEIALQNEATDLQFLIEVSLQTNL
ncbi:hypothetical protein [Salinimicrobium sp. GXAS 041]|uniref:hypothetical protein n=1 Tax=Salinimicrobium sp. GXAS 041 TaxID=3400806 RepID=UPI003C733C38